MNNQPAAAIDVLITVFNGERFISQTIDSVLSQTFKDWRLIVVDDMSTDRTPDVLKNYAQRDSRIVVVQGTHQGIAAAANVGLALVTAPLVARLDGDDIAMPERLRVQFDYLQQHPEVSAVGSDVMLVDEHNKPLRRRKAPTGWVNIHHILKTRNCMCHPSVMLRAGILHQIGGYRNKFKNSLDYDLWLRISMIGRIENISKDLTLYRKHGGQVSSKKNSHRQTFYSVGAAVDYFLRKYNMSSDLLSDDELTSVYIERAFLILYAIKLQQSDQRSLNRHAIRYARFVGFKGFENEDYFRSKIMGKFGLMDKLKFCVYSIFGARAK